MFHRAGKQVSDEAIEGPGWVALPELEVVRTVERDDVLMAELLAPCPPTRARSRLSTAEAFVVRDGLVRERRAWVIPLTENDCR